MLQAIKRVKCQISRAVILDLPTQNLDFDVFHWKQIITRLCGVIENNILTTSRFRCGNFVCDSTRCVSCCGNGLLRLQTVHLLVSINTCGIIKMFQTHARTQSRSLACTHARTYARTHAHTHTHIYISISDLQTVHLLVSINTCGIIIYIYIHVLTQCENMMIFFS